MVVFVPMDNTVVWSACAHSNEYSLHEFLHFDTRICTRTPVASNKCSPEIRGFRQEDRKRNREQDRQTTGSPIWFWYNLYTYLALAYTNMQDRFALRIVLESWVVGIKNLTYDPLIWLKVTSLSWGWAKVHWNSRCWVYQKNQYSKVRRF